MRLMARSVRAQMVRLGFTPRLAEITEPSQTYMFRSKSGLNLLLGIPGARNEAHGAFGKGANGKAWIHAQVGGNHRAVANIHVQIEIRAKSVIGHPRRSE